MKNLTLMIDLDEVTANLSEKVRERVNKDFDKNYPKNFNQSYWWSDYIGVEKSYFELLLNEKDFFLNLEPVDGAIETLTKLNEEGFDIHILTLPQYSNGDCFISKVKWVKKYLPFINIETNFHTTGNKGMFAKEDRLIVDDNPKYLNQFVENGATAIAFNQGWNLDFEGYRAYNWNDVYEIIHTVNSFIKFSNMCEDLKNRGKKNIDVDKFRNYMRGEHNE